MVHLGCQLKVAGSIFVERTLTVIAILLWFCCVRWLWIELNGIKWYRKKSKVILLVINDHKIFPSSVFWPILKLNSCIDHARLTTDFLPYFPFKGTISLKYKMLNSFSVKPFEFIALLVASHTTLTFTFKTKNIICSKT